MTTSCAANGCDKNSPMRGLWTALITPFLSSNEIDFDSYRTILRDQRDAGVTGVIPCGTTGESPTLSLEEKKKLISFTLTELKGSGVSVIAGTGSNNTAETVALSAWASEQGVAGVLVVTPYYNKPSQTGLEAHFRAVADAVTCEVMLYNVPGRTGVSLTSDTIARLSRHERIRSIKEATGNVAFTSEILDAVTRANSKLDVLSGDDATFLPMLSVGATGLVSVASNLIARELVAIQRAFAQGDMATANRLNQKCFPILRDLFIESNPMPIKHAMAYAGFCGPNLRLPLTSLSQPAVLTLESTLRSCGVKPGKRS